MVLDESSWLDIMNTDDLLTIIVRGHVALDTLLSDAIAMSLPASHEIELSRISFPLKVDLAIATGMLRKDSRPSITALNRIRNSFAHKPDAAFGDKQAVELRNTLSQKQRHTLEGEIDGEPDVKLILNRVMTILYVELDYVMSAVSDGRLRFEILREIVDETLADSPVRDANWPGRKKREEEIERRLLERKRRK